MQEWKEIALEYRKEIDELWADIDDAICELERGVPKSYRRGMHILEKNLAISKENVRILSYSEPFEVAETNLTAIPFQKELNKEPMKIVESKEGRSNEDCFKWLRNTKQK